MKLEDIGAYSDLELLVREAMSGSSIGKYHSPYHGYSVEFSQHKAYTPGESIRHLDWKLLARTEKPYLKVFNAETNLNALLWMDVSPSLNFPSDDFSKLRFSLFLNACLAMALQKGRDGVGLVEWNQAHMRVSDVRSSQLHLHKLLATIDQYWNQRLPGRQTPQMNQELNWTELVRQSGRRSLVVISTDLEFHQDQLEQKHQFEEALTLLRHQHCEVILFHIQHGKMETMLELDSNGSTKFVDLETGEQLKLDSRLYRNSYQRAMQKEIAHWKSFCMSLGIDYQWVDASDHIEIPIKAFYSRRNALFR
jgi:uncharacterized protein (DUF58 family)